MKKIFIFFLLALIQNNLFAQREHELISKAQGLKSIEAFYEFLSIPNDGKNKDEILQNIEWSKVQLESFDFNINLLKTSSLPLVLAEKIIDRKLPTIAFYMHLDGQSVDLSKWDQKSPWIPVLKQFDGNSWNQVDREMLNIKENEDLRIFARSTSDDKGPFMMFLTSLKILEIYNKKPAYNIKLILDFEEERSSPGLPEAVEKYKDQLIADLLIILDGPMHSSKKPTLVFGNRGIATITLKVYGPKTPQHSGHYGNFIPNPALRLSRILSSMKSEDGRVVIPGFYDGINITNQVKSIFKDIPSEEELIRNRTKIYSVDKVAESYQESLQYPSLNIRGLQSGWVGSQVRTIIPSTAQAEIDVRLVLESDPLRLVNLIKSHIESLGYKILNDEPNDNQRLSNNKLVKMTYNISYPAFRTPINAKEGKWLKNILFNNFKVNPVLIRTSGGSVPISPFVNNLGIPAIGIPTVNLDNNQHSPNENIRLGNYFNGIETFVSLLLEPFK
jgi:acetylornithine deacetylase/succinyl-diaminopimelate desuccinylase-like protein